MFNRDVAAASVDKTAVPRLGLRDLICFKSLRVLALLETRTKRRFIRSHCLILLQGMSCWLRSESKLGTLALRQRAAFSRLHCSPLPRLRSLGFGTMWPKYQCLTSLLPLRVLIFHAILSSPFLRPRRLALSPIVLYGA